MTLADLPFQSGEAGNNGAWASSLVVVDKPVLFHHDIFPSHYNLAISHYDNVMFHADMYKVDDDRGIIQFLKLDLGRGSLSDQNGMNLFFEVLNLPLYYARDWEGGGPRFTHRNPYKEKHFIDILRSSSIGSSHTRHVTIPHDHLPWSWEIIGDIPVYEKGRKVHGKAPPTQIT